MNRKDVKKIRATNTLAQKVGSGEIDAAKIEAAQATIENSQIDFSELAKPLLDQLKNAIAAAKKDPEFKDREKILNNITFPIMNLKANAATLNYPLISEAAGTVLNFLDAVNKIDNDIVVIADNLHKAITVIVMQKMTGKDNPAGKVLVQEFKDVCKRYLDKNTGAS